MLCPIITLLSDFGLKDSYVAEMKAAILSLSREVQIIDISHQVEKFDVRTGAFLLACAAPYFPEDTIHVAVVDPGVGTVRLPIIIQTLNACYVGPDNGVLALAVRNDGGPGASTKSVIASSCCPTFPALFTAETFSLQQRLAWQTEGGQQNSDPKSARSMPPHSHGSSRSKGH